MSQAVLVIESEPWLGDQYQRGLEQQEFRVARAANAYSAMDMIDEQPPLAIIMGLLLSGGNGLGLLHELQSYIDTATIPVIVCGQLAGVGIEDLRPYGVRRLLDVSSMQPGDLASAVRSVLA